MLARILAIVAVAAVLAAAAQTWRLSGWKQRAEKSEALVEGYEEAVRIRKDQDLRQQALREEASKIDEQLLNREGGDAPLSDYLRDASRYVWP